MVKKLGCLSWHFWHLRHRSPLLIYFYYQGARLAEFSTLKIKNFITNNGTCVNWIITDKNQLKKMEKMVEKIAKENPQRLLRFMYRAYEMNKLDVKKLREMKKVNYDDYSNDRLFNCYKRYIEWQMKYGQFVYIPLCVEAKLTELVQSILRKKFGVAWTEWDNVVMNPVKPSSIMQERKELLKIICNSKLNLDNHIEKFSFLKQKGGFLDFFDGEFYKAEAKKIRNPKEELKKIETEQKNKEGRFKELEKLFFGDKKQLDIIRLVNEAIFFRSWRTDRLEQSMYYAVELFSSIAKRLGLKNCNDLVWLYPNEVEKGLKSKSMVDKKLIKDRKEAFVYVTFDSKCLIEQGKVCQTIKKQLPLEKFTGENLQGKNAYQGIASGRVVVVRTKEDYDKISNGEILVVHSTIPEMVSYLKDIKAIVTEEGGILSHAAVISREFKIPCVIGTKFATQMFNNGDIVEVNANKGLVRKIK